jgi:hypothetical protein
VVIQLLLLLHLLRGQQIPLLLLQRENQVLRLLLPLHLLQLLLRLPLVPLLSLLVQLLLRVQSVLRDWRLFDALSFQQDH